MTDKDTFMEYYKRLLSTRLLQNKSQNNDLETLIISYLTTELSLARMKNIQTMMSDFTESKTTSEQYRQTCNITKPQF